MPLQKMSNPASEDDLRIISLTSQFSKVFEQLVIGWLLEYVSDKLDWGQYGGKKGSSISHYLIDFVNFILFNQDLKVPQAVVAVLIDYSKAFNRANHNLIITILSEMGVPGWLLKIVIGFLRDRELIVRYKGKHSSRKTMPGGTPQGTILGLFLFLIIVNSAGFKHLEKNLGSKITLGLNKRTPLPYNHMKYVDDLSLVKSMNLRKCLINNPNPVHPVTYHDRTHHLLPSTTGDMQAQLDRLHAHSQEHSMQINHNKSKVMIFNTSRNFDFSPKLTLPDMGDGEYLEVVESTKLLGVVIRSDTRWYDNTNYICKKGYQRLWMIRRLKNLGANEEELLDVYIKQVRSVLELAVPVWHPGLTQQEIYQIERVQKCALHIILGETYGDYKNALQTLNCETLNTRRVKLCENFAKKASKSIRFSNWFTLNTTQPTITTRKHMKTNIKYLPVQTRTNRFKNSSVPYLTDILNNKK